MFCSRDTIGGWYVDGSNQKKMMFLHEWYCRVTNDLLDFTFVFLDHSEIENSLDYL